MVAKVRCKLPHKQFSTEIRCNNWSADSLLDFLVLSSAEHLKYTDIDILKFFLIYFKTSKQCSSMYFEDIAE